MPTITFTHIRLRQKAGPPILISFPEFWTKVKPVFEGFKIGARAFGTKKAQKDTARALECIELCGILMPDLVTHFAIVFWPDTVGWVSLTDSEVAVHLAGQPV